MDISISVYLKFQLEISNNDHLKSNTFISIIIIISNSRSEPVCPVNQQVNNRKILKNSFCLLKKMGRNIRIKSSELNVPANVKFK